MGKSDCVRFAERMKITDPMDKLAAGPVAFAFTGWASVSIIPGPGGPSPDEKFCLAYDHPYSFESAAYMRAKIKTQKWCVLPGRVELRRFRARSCSSRGLRWV